MPKIKIGLIGLGTVGQEFVKQMQTIREEDCPVEILQIAVRNLTKPRGKVDIGSAELTNDLSQVVNNENVDVIVELAGGEDKFPYIMQAIRNGKHVITANKAMLAAHGTEIFSAAREHNVWVGYEAAIAGAIPIIKIFRDRVMMHDINDLSGIFNATTNYILSTMESEGISYEQALRKAQENGYAEADPHLDVDGYDAMHKLLILSSLACKTPVLECNVSVHGITHITAADIAMASRCGVRIKLVCQMMRSERGICVSVRPVLLPASSMLANVQGAQSCIEFVDANAGKMIFIGEGAGGTPTATAVLQDLIDIARGPSLAAIKAQTVGFVPDRKAISFVSANNIPSAYCIAVPTIENTEQFKEMFCALAKTRLTMDNMHLFTSNNQRYLLVRNITLTQLTSVLPWHAHPIAVDHAAYPLIEKQSLLFQEQQSAMAQVTLPSIQCSSTMFANITAVATATSSSKNASFSAPVIP